MPNLIARVLIVGAMLGVSGVAACGGDEGKSADSTPVAAPVVRPSGPRPGEADCPLDGTWRPCGLMDRILSTGLAPKALPDTTRVPFFAVPGIRYQIGRSATLTAFFFADSNAATLAASRIDTVLVRMPGDSTAPWSGTPHFMRSANLIAILESENPQQVERMMLAITAGAP